MDIDILFSDLEPICIDTLLKQVDNLPVRLINQIKKEQFYSLESFFSYFEKLKLEYTSNILFPGRYMAFYPQVREYHARNFITCNLSGTKIFPGSSYYVYSPFIEDLKSEKVYCLKKKICTASDYVDLLPRDLITYETWNYKIKNAYFYMDQDDEIDFYLLSTECGENCLEPFELGKSKRKGKSR